MMKQAWRSYLASLHPRNLKKAYEKGALFQLVYWFVIYPLIMNAINDTFEFFELMLLMFMRMMPFFIMEWSNLNSKFLMPKAMYLSPMKEQEREEYIKDVLLIKIGVSVLLGMCIEVVWGIFTGLHMSKVIIMVLVNLSIGVAHFISVKKKGTNIFAEVVAFLIMLFIAFLEIGAEESLAIFSNWFILIAMIVLVVLDMEIIRKKYRMTIAYAEEYEVAFRVEGKVEPKQVKYDLFAKKE